MNNEEIRNATMYRKAREVLMRIRPGEMTRTTPREKVVTKAIEVLGSNISGDPEMVIALLLSIYKPDTELGNVAAPRMPKFNNRVYTMTRAMQRVARRSACQPPILSIVTRNG